MNKYIRDECTCRNFSLQHDRPNDLVRCAWSCIHPSVYLIYRAILAILFVVTLIFMGIDAAGPKYFIYMTNWGYMTLTFSMVWKCICALVYLPWWRGRQFVDHLTNGNVGKATKKSIFVSLIVLILGSGTDDEFVGPLFRQTVPFILKVSWFFSNMTTSVAIFITIVYWSILAPLAPYVKYLSVQAHLVNSIAVLLDVFLSAIPFRLLHFYHPLIFGGLYIIFNGIYWAAGGTDTNGKRPIYPITNWDNLELSIPAGLIGGLMGLTVIHITICGFAKLRQKLAGTTGSQAVISRSTTSIANDNPVVTDGPV